MFCIPPLEMNDTRLVSSTHPEPSSNEQVWDSGDTYALKERVIDLTTHRTYESLQAGNTNHALPTPPETQNDWWIDVGATERWAMLDLYRSVGTVADSPLIVEVAPGQRINGLGLFGMVADTVTITMVNAGDVVYTRVINLNTRVVTDWYSYFFEPFSSNPSMIVTDLPPYSGATVEIKVESSTGTVTCGGFGIGPVVDLGLAQNGAQSDALNFSRIERNDFGDSLLIPRRSVPKTSQEVWCDAADVNRIRDLRTQLNAVPAIWSGLSDPESPFYESLVILGIYKTFSITIDGNKKARINLELEEV